MNQHPESTNQQPATSIQQIGPLILRMQALREEVDHLKLLLQGANHPENIGHYHQSMNEKQATLNQLDAQLKTLREAELDRLRTRAVVIATEMDTCMDGFEIEELKAHLREVENKIDSLNKIIAHEHA